MSDLGDWWMQHSINAYGKTFPKALSYGSDDLVFIGRALADLANLPSDDDARCAELGVFFYALGKIARIRSGLTSPDGPGEDSWFDLEIYAKMAQRIRQSGGWPGGPAEAFRKDDEPIQVKRVVGDCRVPLTPGTVLGATCQECSHPMLLHSSTGGPCNICKIHRLVEKLNTGRM